MITVTCRCGKMAYGSEAMAGEAVQCLKCGAQVTFPGVARQAAAPGAAGAAAGAANAPAPVPAGPPPPLRRRGLDLFYFLLVLALLPLVNALWADKAEFKK